MYRVRYFTPAAEDQELYESFLTKMGGDIQQSYNIGAFQQGIGLMYCLGVFAGETGTEDGLVAVMTLKVQLLPFGLTWLYCPRGPVWEKPDSAMWKVLFKEIRKIAQRERAVFLRVEPQEKQSVCLASQATVDSQHAWVGLSEFKLKFGGQIFRYDPAVEYVFKKGWYAFMKFVKQFQGHKVLRRMQLEYRELPQFWKEHGFILAHASYQPEWTNVVELRLSEEDILKQMKPKGRYNIRLAEKKGIKVSKWRWEKDRKAEEEKESVLTLDEATSVFFRLMHETTARDGFFAHDAGFYKRMFQNLSDFDRMLLFIAYLPDSPSLKPEEQKLGGKPLAAIVVTFFGNTALYFCGASANEYRNLKAADILQWTAMQEAKGRGCRWYDFFGVGPVAFRLAEKEIFQNIENAKKDIKAGKRKLYRSAKEMVRSILKS